MKKFWVALLLVLAVMMVAATAMAAGCGSGNHDWYCDEDAITITVQPNGNITLYNITICCKNCTYTKTGNYNDSDGQGDITQKADCVKPELTRYETRISGFAEFDLSNALVGKTVETAPSLGGHDYTGPDTNCYTPKICNRAGCNEVLEPAGHIPGPIADCTTPQVCARGCGYVYASASGHNYQDMTNKEYTNLGVNHDVDGICPSCGAEIGYIEAHIYYTHVDGSEKCACGALDPDYVAPIPDGLNPEDGYVYEGGVRSDFTGLYPYNGGLFYILNGQWQRGANGLTLIIDEFWYLSNGQVQEHYGFAEYDGEWFYLDGGMLDQTASGLFEYNGEWFLVAAGRLVDEHSGLAQIPNGDWYYIAEGRMLQEYSGEAEYDGKVFQIVNGKLAA